MKICPRCQKTYADDNLNFCLEDGSVHLSAGDAVVVNGVEHSWLAGPDGCLIATVMVGLRKSER